MHPGNVVSGSGSAQPEKRRVNRLQACSGGGPRARFGSCGRYYRRPALSSAGTIVARDYLPRDYLPPAPGPEPPSSRIGSARLAFRTQVGDARLHESPDKARRRRLGQRKSDRPLGGLVASEIGRMRAPERRADWIEATVVCPGGIPYQHSSIEPEGGNPVADGLTCVRGRGASLAAFPGDDEDVIQSASQSGGTILRTWTIYVLPMA